MLGFGRHHDVNVELGSKMIMAKLFVFRFYLSFQQTSLFLMFSICSKIGLQQYTELSDICGTTCGELAYHIASRIFADWNL